MTNKREVANVGEIFGVLAKDRKSLVADLQNKCAKFLSKAKVNGRKTVLLSVTLPCGNSRNWQTYRDIPNSSVKCKCKAHPAHYFIKFGATR